MKIQLYVKNNGFLRDLNEDIVDKKRFCGPTIFYYKTLEDFENAIWYDGEENLKRRIRKYYV